MTHSPHGQLVSCNVRYIPSFSSSSSGWGLPSPGQRRSLSLSWTEGHTLDTVRHNPQMTTCTGRYTWELVIVVNVLLCVLVIVVNVLLCVLVIVVNV